MSERQYFDYKCVRVPTRFFMAWLTKGNRIENILCVEGLVDPVEVVKMDLEPWANEVLIWVKVKSDVPCNDGSRPQEERVVYENQVVVGPPYLGVVKVAS